MSNQHSQHQHSQHHHGGHDHHGHDNDQGIKGALRYLRHLPDLWRSPINDAVIDLVEPQRGERVLDIGAGMGAGAMRAASTGAHVLAVEPTPFMRRLLQLRRLFSRNRKSVEVVDGAAEQLPVADQSIDAIWAVNTMHHWVDVDRGAAEIARVLKPGGRVLLVDELFNDPSHPEYEESETEHGPEHHGFTMVEADQMGSALQAAGLIEVDASDVLIAERPVIQVTAHGSE